MRRDRGLTLAELLVVLVLLMILASLLIPAISRSIRHDKIETCASNLKFLRDAQEAYISRHPAGASELGKSFWLKLSRTSPPLVDPSDRKVYLCPLREDPEGTECHYLGPAVNVTTLGPEDPLGCDELLNHSPRGKEGGNVVLKSGAIVTGQTDVWGQCTKRGRCRP
jgi:type II secretory pathway pseudopilin PulG